MKEDLLQFIWQFGKFNQKNMTTTDGDKILILQPGFINHKAGPDFQQARIKIGDTEWAGNIEIHINASDWNKHGHQHDINYKNVILHVVYHNDIKDFHLPTLELKDRISNALLNRYQTLMENQQFVACEYFLPAIDDFTWMAWKERLVTERMQQKTQVIINSLKTNKNNWQQVFYEQLAYNFGLKSNENAFLELAKRIPLTLIAKHKNNLLQIEALLFGTAGLIASSGDNYTEQLQKEFNFLQKKYEITPMSITNWNFGGVRPPNQPTIRIAQFAALLANSSALFSKVMDVQNSHQFRQYFTQQPSEYWNNHYVFGKTSLFKRKPIGKSKFENILINTIAPFQFIYGQSLNKEELVNNSFNLLRELPTEKNKIITEWKTHEVKCKTSFDSQALLQLYKHYCKIKKCLHCRVGHAIFAKKE